jgi:exonuclease III
MIRFSAFFIFLFFTFSVHPFVDAQQIILDDSFTDWQGNNIASFKDKSGDGNTSGIDFTDVKISNDDAFLYVYFDLKKEINLQQNNFLALYVDIDNQVSTGLNISGIGADLVYFFGPRNGKYYSANQSISVFHNDIGLISSPTVTSHQFEVGIKRSFSTGLGTGKMGDKIRILVSDENVAGDKAPDISGGYTYTMDNNRKFTPVPFSIQKEKKEYLRILSYNVLRDRMFVPQFASAYERVLKTITPDIIGFCEIYDNTSAQTAAFVENILPSSGPQKWHHAALNPDIRIVSRYPILQSRSLDGNGAFLLELGYSKLVYIVAHLPCCENDLQRQQEVDNIMSFVRGIRFGISSFQVPQNTPIIISGDMNFVGQRRQPQTFMTGDIMDNGRYGPDFQPDWDDSDLKDATPLTTNTSSAFTWYNGQGTFSPGRLDYFFYTNSVMDLKNSYSLWTPSMTNAQLVASGLRKGDVEDCSDHLPVVCDFFIKTNASSLQNTESNDDTYITWDGVHIIARSQKSGRLQLYDMSGKMIFDTEVAGSQIETTVTLSSLLDSDGLYLCQLVMPEKLLRKKIVFFK